MEQAHIQLRLCRPAAQHAVQFTACQAELEQLHVVGPEAAQACLMVVLHCLAGTCMCTDAWCVHAVLCCAPVHPSHTCASRQSVPRLSRAVLLHMSMCRPARSS